MSATAVALPQHTSVGQPRPVRRGSGGPVPPVEKRKSLDFLMICACAFILTAVARVHHLVPGMTALRPITLAALASVAVWVMNPRGARAWQRLKLPYGKVAAFLLVWATLSAPFGVYPGASISYLMGDVYKTAILFFILALAIRDFHDLRRLAAVYLVGAVIYALLASDASAFRGLGEGSYDANDAAMFMVGAVPFALYFIATGNIIVKLLSVGGAAALIQAFVLSGSRGAFIAFGAVLLYVIFFFQGAKLLYRLAFLGIVIGGVAASGSEWYWTQMRSITTLNEDYNATETTGRKALWTRGMGYMIESPVFGVGINNFAFRDGNSVTVRQLNEMGQGTRWSAPHSIWVEMGSELGVPGLVAFAMAFLVPIVMLKRVAGRARKARPPRPEEAAMCDALILHLIALAVAGSFLTLAWGAFIWTAFGLSLGALKVVAMRDRLAARSMAPARSPVAVQS